MRQQQVHVGDYVVEQRAARTLLQQIEKVPPHGRRVLQEEKREDGYDHYVDEVAGYAEKLQPILRQLGDQALRTRRHFGADPFRDLRSHRMVAGRRVLPALHHGGKPQGEHRSLVYHPHAEQISERAHNRHHDYKRQRQRRRSGTARRKNTVEQVHQWRKHIGKQ